MSQQIFSESWHIVSGLNLSLLPTVSVQKQNYRGKEWYVLKDSFNNKFFRIKPEAYQFIMRLNINATVEETWEKYLASFPDITPTQDELVKLLSQLHLNNLLFFKNRAQSLDVFERHNEQKNKMLKSKFLSFLFIKVPIFNPEKLLNFLQPFANWLFSRFGFVIWLAVVGYGIKVVIDNSTLVSSQAEGILAPSNLMYLFIVLFILKVLHEFGHALICKKFGGPVYTIGIMFLVFTPLPYMDASSSWSFRNKWHRALVGSAGMLVELFLAAIAAVVWMNTGEGFIHSLSFNVMIIGSISSLVFNANPLLKLDAYYILSDVLEIPNLSKRSNEYFLYLLKKYLFGVEHLIGFNYTFQESSWLVIYAILSYLYRLLVSLTIMFFVADQFFLLGVLVAVMSLFIWVLKPLYSLFLYLSSSPELNKNRVKATLMTMGFVSMVVFILSMLPMSNSIRASGVLYATEFKSLYSVNEGFLKEVYIENGEEVKKGDLIAVMVNEELILDIAVTKAKLEQTHSLELQAQRDIADLKPLKERILLLKEQLQTLEEKEKKLSIYAESGGVWIAPNLKFMQQSFLKKGEHLGDIIPQTDFRFIAVVPQEKAFDLFGSDAQSANLKLYGIAQKTIEVKNIDLIPYKQHLLPSAALGWLGGGDIQVRQDDSSGKNSVEAFFEIRTKVAMQEENPALFHHRLGVLRIALADTPLLFQFMRFLEQLMQKKYQI
ncbi:MAG: Peptidase, M50 family [uncultured Sulfurovum sp.]|uniref:Peptidase, M50 family n=1 Tax=uncultured Sulfurovum sp. TaxID=269237 RepID=A0A6S6SVU1_9BACT|nr:MAG: Peptidase, M50 family [uncultured Sulfurovum sp.]